MQRIAWLIAGSLLFGDAGQFVLACPPDMTVSQRSFFSKPEIAKAIHEEEPYFRGVRFTEAERKAAERLVSNMEVTVSPEMHEIDPIRFEAPQKLEKLFDIYLTARLRDCEPRVKQLVDVLLKNIQIGQMNLTTQRSTRRSIHLNMPPGFRNSGFYYFMLVYEIEVQIQHAEKVFKGKAKQSLERISRFLKNPVYEFVSSPLAFLSIRQYDRMFGGIRAQYEFLNAIPMDIRKRMRVLLDEVNMPELIRDIFHESLTYSQFSVDHYMKRMMDIRPDANLSYIHGFNTFLWFVAVFSTSFFLYIMYLLAL